MFNSIRGWIEFRPERLEEKFKKSHLRKIEFTSTRNFHPERDFLNSHKFFEHTVGCHLADDFNNLILDPNSNSYRRGCIILLDNLPLGQIKFAGDQSLLSWQNIRTPEGNKLILGGIYKIPSNLAAHIRGLDPINNNWNILEVSKISLSPKRMAKFPEYKTRIIQEKKLFIKENPEYQ